MSKSLVIVDKSRLAMNFYSVLLSSLGNTLIELRDISSLAERVKRREKIDMVIVNSNVFKKGAEKTDFAVFRDERGLYNIPKLFLCKDQPSDEVWKIVLKELNKSHIVIRPFHPDEVLKAINSIFGA